jgi:nucleotide-binding universal stress UspA family protein
MNDSEIVVGLDNSPPAKAALRCPAEQARLIDVRLRAVSVVDWPLGVHADGRPVLRAAGVGQYHEIGYDYRAMISRLFAEIDPPSDWVLEFEVGKAGHVLVRASEHARLLVVGTGEHVGLGKILLGSTSHHCLSHSRCPVVAVPTPHPQPVSQISPGSGEAKPRRCVAALCQRRPWRLGRSDSAC